MGLYDDEIMDEQAAEISRLCAALLAIIDRSHNGELGTSKVIDMRKIAEGAINDELDQRISYRKMLRTYVDHVGYAEGVDFLDDCCLHGLNAAEVAELEKIRDNSRMA